MSDMTTVLELPRLEEQEEKKTGGMIFVVLSGDFERVFAAFTLASTAAASGIPTKMFFTFWGLFSLVKNDRGMTGKNWMQKMMSVINPGGTEKLKLSQYHFSGMGTSMMRTLAKQNGMATPQELLEAALDLGVEMIPCQMTMDVLGLTKADMIDGIAEPAGAATVVALMQENKALFI